MPESKSVIRTPDQRLRVFVSSTLQELAEERVAARQAITHLRLAPVLFELGARPHPPRELYRAYLDQSHIFVGVYWQKYGWIAPSETISGLEDEYRLSGERPKLIYVKTPAPDREPRLKALLDRIRSDDTASYKPFTTAAELRDLIENDLAMILTERFESAHLAAGAPSEEATRAQGNLPVVRTPLVGRARELALTRELLLRESSPARLVTLTGPGGIGKTRLALEAANSLGEWFSDGIYLISLAPLTDPSLIVPAIAQTLGMRETADRPLRDNLIDYLHDKRILLLLDNFEHVVAGAGAVGELLEACPLLKIVATSQTPLRIRGERELPLPPLALPRIGALAARSGDIVSQLSQYAAVELFIQRARDVRPDLSVTNETAPAVAEICYRLDGLPLAIELAAARIKVLSPQALLARLERRLDVLKRGARDLPARQQTMRGALDWSHDLLCESERTLFRRVSVFVGGCTLEAVEFVCVGLGTDEVDLLDQLTSLVDKSLLVQDEMPGGEPRFRMLQVIQGYARQKLVESGEANVFLRRHAGFYCMMAEEAEPYLMGAARTAWLDRLEMELDNLRAALDWSRQSGADMLLRLSGSLAWFWFMRGHLSEGRAWLDSAIACAPRLAATADGARARSLWAAGGLAWAQGDYARARLLIQESLAIYREVHDRHGSAHALSFLGLVMLSLAEPSEAHRLCEEAVSLSREVNDKWGEAFALRCMGDAALLLGDVVGARALYETSLGLWRKVNDPWGISMPLNDLGRVAYVREDYAEARAAYEESVALLRRVGDKWGLALVLTNLANVLIHQDVQAARTVLQECLSTWRELGNKTGVAQCLAAYAGLAAVERRPALAAQLFGAADAQLGAIGYRPEGMFRAQIERNRSVGRAQLDETTWRAEWERGRGLPTDEAIALAMQLEQLPTQIE